MRTRTSRDSGKHDITGTYLHKVGDLRVQAAAQLKESYQA